MTLILDPNRPQVGQVAAAAGIEVPDSAWPEAIGRKVPLWDTDLAWHVATFDASPLADHAAAAKRLYLEVVEFAPDRGVLIHRQGWPFDLRTTPIADVTDPPAQLPVGPGDEVMRDLITSADYRLWVWGEARRPEYDVPQRAVEGVSDPAAIGLCKLLGWAVVARRT